MGKIIEKVRLMSLFNPEKSVEIDAVIDTGATMMVLPQNIVDELNLKKLRETTVKYANNQRQKKTIYGGLLIEIKGRIGNFDTIAEEEGTEPLVGQIVLEELDLVIEPGARKLIPNPRSPDIPMVEIL